ncbi:hypothetical protein EST38_g12006 [Candolleomyces aberdarensis]|uniref:RING-type domain-containing protein n=1 Tax=Candolleomyces aberdarensis TaxID=2316362 RepID=A0A4V1Q249_9AGAR|nr:hypothetical protein EST38_g12006 [Candolleomyces aberdarensis]
MHILCGVCFSVLDNVGCPASYLPCGHVFCTSCCKDLVGRTGCPLKCRPATLLSHNIRPLLLTTVPALGAAHGLPYTATADDAMAVSQASVCSRVQQEVLEARRAYFIQAIKVNEIAKDHLLAEGMRIMAQRVACKQRLISSNAQTAQSRVILVGERLSAESLAKELGNLERMIQCQRERLNHVLRQGKLYVPSLQYSQMLTYIK